MPKLGDKNDTYKRTRITIQERLTKEEIKDKLTNYEQVDDISKVILNTHVRYFLKKDNIYLFRLGGMLYKINNDLQYVVLSNGKKTWSVNMKTAIFWKKK